MTDEPQAPEESQESLAQEVASQEGTPTEQQEHDYEQRWKDTEAAFTKERQWRTEVEPRYSQLTQWWDALNNPDTQVDALRQLGVEVTQAEEEALENNEFRDPRVDQLIEQQQEMLLAQQAQQLQGELETGITQRAASKEVELSERQLNVIFRDAIEIATSRKLPPAQAAEEAFKDWFDEFEQVRTKAVESYRGTKKPRNTPPPKPGQSGVPEIPRNDSKAKLALANQIAEEAAQSF